MIIRDLKIQYSGQGRPKFNPWQDIYDPSNPTKSDHRVQSQMMIMMMMKMMITTTFLRKCLRCFQTHPQPHYLLIAEGSDGQPFETQPMLLHFGA